jgi:hypothetical protein
LFSPFKSDFLSFSSFLHKTNHPTIQPTLCLTCFSGILIGVPIATALAARIFIIEPVLAYTLADPEAFPLSYMQEVEGAHEVSPPPSPPVSL